MDKGSLGEGSLLNTGGARGDTDAAPASPARPAYVKPSDGQPAVESSQSIPRASLPKEVRASMQFFADTEREMLSCLFTSACKSN
jgi:hypothetical protein